jgi:hypothetical protein
VTGSGTKHGEATVGAIAPGSGSTCSEGRIYVATGGHNLLMRKLANPGAGPFFNETFPAAGPSQSSSGSSDNQMARLANGDLLLLWQGNTTATLSDGSTPDWWNNWLVETKWDDPATKEDHSLVDVPGVLKVLTEPQHLNGRQGFRSAHLLWRFSAATCQWSGPTAVDSGELSTTFRNGLLQRGYCAQLAPGLAGFDRPELYVDPWGVNSNDKQRIYVSTFCGRCKKPPCPSNQGLPLDDDNVQLYTSLDSGATWKPGIRLNPPQPMAMTSTPPNGRLFMFQLVDDGDDPGAKIYWVDPNTDGTPGPVQGPWDVTYMPVDTKTNKNLPDPKDPSKPLRLLPGFVAETDVGVARGTKKAIALARTGNNAVLAVYPTVEEVTIGSSTISRQVAAVVWVVTKGTNDCPTVVPMKVIRAQDPKGSVIFATFIEDDRSDAKNATSMLYWLETTSQPASGTNTGMLARYMLFTNGIFPGKEELLSTSGGWQVKNADPIAWLGDYMKGGFYFHDGKLNFVAVWPQVSQTGTPPQPNNGQTQPYVRIISLQPPGSAAVPAAEEMPGAKKAPGPPPVRSGGTKKGAEPCPTPTL